MTSIDVKRIDHHGLVAGVIDDLQIPEIIDSCLPPNGQESVTFGEAVKAMIMNGLGFTNRPISLTPQFFENLPLSDLFGHEVTPEDLNRHKLGRTLDALWEFGCEALFTQIAYNACHLEDIQCNFLSEDTSTFSVTGEYDQATDEQEILVTHGYSKDNRPDIKQVVHELMVAQDGGVPLMTKSWDGNTDDHQVFRERARNLVENFQHADDLRVLIGDSKLYAEPNSKNLASIPFITRVPGTLNLEKRITEQALQHPEDWAPLDGANSYQRFDLCHYGIEQRWLVIFSHERFKGVQKTVAKERDKENEKIRSKLFHLQAKRFDSKEKALQALEKLRAKWKYHRLRSYDFTEHKRYGSRGRPSRNASPQKIEWQIHAEYEEDQEALQHAQQKRACFVLGTNVDTDKLSDAQILAGYKGQSKVERGFRFLKDNAFFVSSLYVEKPSRIEALIMIMTLALLVYAVAQRRLRLELWRQDETLPNQINQPTQRITLRWSFQMLEGINVVTLDKGDEKERHMDGLTSLRIKILKFFGENVCRKYGLSPATDSG